ncbi:DUF975 family protein [Clostridium perfringens]
MVTRAETKTKAKDLLRGSASNILSSKRFWVVLLAGIIIGICTSLGSYLKYKYDSDLANLLFSVILIPMLSLGMVGILKGIYEEQIAEFSRLFEVFKSGANYKVILINLLYGLIMIVGYLLLIVPGVIWTFKYTQVNNIFREDPNQGIWECFQKSGALMKGHKFEYFVLQLSFILWGLLCVVTFGLAMIYVVPYVQMTNYVYYKELMEENNVLEVIEITEE